MSRTDAQAITPDIAAALIRGRRTVAKFESEAPPSGLIEQAVEAARWAPNHRLTQPWRFYRLGPKTVAGIIELNGELVAAKQGAEAAAAKRARWSAVPGWLLVTRLRHDDDLIAREDYAAVACAVQNLMLYLHSAGVACKWTTGEVTRQRRFYELLAIDPAREEAVCLLWYGWPAQAPRQRRKPVAEILHDRP